jgi:hypothetical protein
VSKADDYEAKALECLELSDQYLEPGNTSQWVALRCTRPRHNLGDPGAMHRNDDYNEDVELYNAEVDIYNRSHWGSAVWAWLKRK